MFYVELDGEEIVSFTNKEGHIFTTGFLSSINLVTKFSTAVDAEGIVQEDSTVLELGPDYNRIIGSVHAQITTINVPYKAVKALAEAAMAAGKIVNLKKENWAAITDEYKSGMSPA